MPPEYVAWIGLYVTSVLAVAVLAGRRTTITYGGWMYARAWVMEFLFAALMISGAGGLEGWKHNLLLLSSVAGVLIATFNFARHIKATFTGAMLAFVIPFGCFETWLLVTG